MKRVECFAKVIEIFYYFPWLEFLEMIDLGLLNRNDGDNKESITPIDYVCSGYEVNWLCA